MAKGVGKRLTGRFRWNLHDFFSFRSFKPTLIGSKDELEREKHPPLRWWWSQSWGWVMSPPEKVAVFPWVVADSSGF